MIQKGNTYTISGNQVTFTTTGTGVVYWEYTYDLLNRLIQVTENGTIVAAYGYDPTGLRVIKRVYSGGSQTDTIHYIFEGAEPILEQKMSDGSVHSYVYAMGKYLARVDGAIGDSTANVYYFLTDYQGSIKAVTDQTGAIVFNADYLPFGTQFGQNGSFADPHGFTGKEYDPDIGLYYFNARWYDPETGRFISEDPAADPNSPNLYSYCGNNPVIRTDPSGKIFGIDDFLFFMLAGGIFGGIDSVSHGGSFMAGFASGFCTVGLTCALGLLGAGLIGGLESSATGGNFFSGFGSAVLGGVLDDILPGNIFKNGSNIVDELILYGFKTELRALVTTGQEASFLDTVEDITDQYAENGNSDQSDDYSAPPESVADEYENGPQPDDTTQATSTDEPAPAPGPGAGPASTPNPPSVTDEDVGTRIANAAASLGGSKYGFYGEAELGCADCSGSVFYSGTAAGLDFLRETAQGYYYDYPSIDRSDLEKGDLIFYEYPNNPNSNGETVTHVQIYIGYAQETKSHLWVDDAVLNCSPTNNDYIVSLSTYLSWTSGNPDQIVHYGRLAP